ncbi:hypothetical protein ACFL2U_03915, partial [Patescibacteria group bacterium]
RLLVMAILVNFSKTICGVIIDFFQVIMLSFVNAFKDIAEGNIFKGLGVDWWFSADEAPDTSEDLGAPSGLYAVFVGIMGLIYVSVACIVILVFATILAFRIVALWILIILSPLAFFSYAFSDLGGQIGKISGEWWGKFLNYCMIGPFLAFFLWLSISTMTELNAAQMADPSDYDGIEICADSEACQLDNMIGFFMSIVLLVGGLVYSANFGVVGSQWGASKVQNMRGRASAALDRGARMAVGAATFVPRRAMRPISAKVMGSVGGNLARLSDKYIHGAPSEKGRVGRFIDKARKAPVVGGVVDRAARAGGSVSRGGRAFLRGTTDKGQDQLYRETFAAARSKGPKGLAEEEERAKIDEEMIKDIEQESGAIDSQKKYTELLNHAKDTGDYRRHRALLGIGAKKGFMQEKDVDDFRERFTGKGKMYKGEDDMAWVRYTQKLEDTHYEQTGEVLPLNKYVLDDEGQLIDREDYDEGGRHKETMKKHERMSDTDAVKLANNSTTGDIFSARGEKMKETRMSNLFGLASNPDSHGRFGKAASGKLQERIGQVLESKEGQALTKKMIDEGKIDEKDLENLDNMYWRMGGDYDKNTGAAKEGSKTVKEIKARSGTGDQRHSDIINDLKATTKSSLGKEMAREEKIENVGNIKTDTLENIQDSFTGKLKDENGAPLAGVAVGGDYQTTGLGKMTKTGLVIDKEQRLKNQKKNTKLKGAREESRAIVRAVDINKAIKGTDLTDEENVKKKIKEAIEKTKGKDKEGKPMAATSKEIDKAWRDAKKGEFTQGNIRKKAAEFQANYGSVEDKTQAIKVSIESEAHDDAVQNFADTLAGFKSGEKDTGDLEAAAEEAILSTETMNNKTESAGKQLKIEVDGGFKKDKKKLEGIGKRFRSTKKPEDKEKQAEELLAHFMKTQEKYAEGSASKGYFKGEYKKDQIARELDKLPAHANLKNNAVFMAGVTKAMKGDIKQADGSTGAGSYENMAHLKQAIEDTLKKQGRTG